MSPRLLLTLRIIMPLIALGCLIFLPPWKLVGAWIQPLPSSVQAQVEEGLEYGFEGIIVYLDKASEKSQWYTAGWHNSQKKIPAKPDALFKIASIGKLYDAVAITRLIHNGKLLLDDTLSSLFPEFAPRIQYADKITVEMLIKHRSGLPNLTDTPNFWINPPKTAEESLERILDLPADFQPGTQYAYSNTNYLLLGLLIEKLCGMPSFTFIQAEFLEPLGLQQTYGSIHDSPMEQIMSGYYVGVEEDIKSTNYGSMIASAADVGSFVRALNDGSLFREGEAELYASLYEYGHTGLIPGYQSIAKYHPEVDAVVVQFTNTTNFDGYEWTLSEILYSRILKLLEE